MSFFLVPLVSFYDINPKSIHVIQFKEEKHMSELDSKCLFVELVPDRIWI